MSPLPQDPVPAVERLPRLTLGQRWQRIAEESLRLFLTRPHPFQGCPQTGETFTDNLQAKYDPQSIGLNLSQWMRGTGLGPQGSEAITGKGDEDADDIRWETLPESGHESVSDIFSGTLGRSAGQVSDPGEPWLNGEKPRPRLFSQQQSQSLRQPSLTPVQPLTQPTARLATDRLPAMESPRLENEPIRPSLSPVQPLTQPTARLATDRLPAMESPRLENEPIRPSSSQAIAKKAVRQQHWLNQIEHSSYRVISHRLKSFLGSLLSVRVPPVKIYANPAADALTRQFQADALTYDDKILFRAGRYEPQQPAGLALLGHELTHVAVGHRSHSLGAMSAASEEALALANEHQVLNYGRPSPEPSSPGRSLSPPLRPLRPSPPEASSQPTHPLQGSAFPQVPSRGTGFVPKTAKADRPIDSQLPSDTTRMPAPDLSPRQLDQVYQYIKAKIRESGERWGIR